MSHDVAVKTRQAAQNEAGSMHIEGDETVYAVAGPPDAAVDDDNDVTDDYEYPSPSVDNTSRYYISLLPEVDETLAVSTRPETGATTSVSSSDDGITATRTEESRTDPNVVLDSASNEQQQASYIEDIKLT